MKQLEPFLNALLPEQASLCKNCGIVLKGQQKDFCSEKYRHTCIKHHCKKCKGPMGLRNDALHCPRCKLGGHPWKCDGTESAFKKILKRNAELFNLFQKEFLCTTSRDENHEPAWKKRRSSKGSTVGWG